MIEFVETEMFLQDICFTELQSDLRGNLFYIAKQCRRFVECDEIGTKHCETTDDIEYCEICEEAAPFCPRCTLH